MQHSEWTLEKHLEKHLFRFTPIVEQLLVWVELALLIVLEWIPIGLKKISGWVPIARVQGNQYMVTSPMRTGRSDPLNTKPGTLIC